MTEIFFTNSAALYKMGVQQFQASVPGYPHYDPGNHYRFLLIAQNPQMLSDGAGEIR